MMGEGMCPVDRTDAVGIRWESEEVDVCKNRSRDCLVTMSVGKKVERGEKVSGVSVGCHWRQ